MYKFNGEQTFQVRDEAGGMLVELLSAGRQVVLPPSIHPETNKPYVANANLWEVIDKVPALPFEVEALLRGLVQDHGVKLTSTGHSKMTDWVPAGARDISMTQMAGTFAFAVRRGECSLKDAIGHLQSWADSRTEKIAGDPLNIEQGVMNIVKFLRNDVLEHGKILPVGWDKGMEEGEKDAMGLDFGEDDVEWTIDQLRDYLFEQFQTHNRHATRERLDAVEMVLKKIASSPNLSDLECENLYNFIKDTSGIGINVSVMRKRVKELQKDSLIDGESHAEVAKALMEDYNQVSEIRYDGGRFFLWQGAYWGEMETADLKHKIAEKYGHLPAARRSSDHKGIVEVLAAMCKGNLKTMTGFHGVNFANGVLTQKLELVAHDKEYGFTYNLPFRYVPEDAHRADQFQKFLHDSWGRDADYADKVAAFQEAMCSTMFGLAYQYQRAPLLYGPAKSGKSVLLDIVREMVPLAGRTVCGPETWKDRFAPASLFGKILNVCGELSDTVAIEGQKFKEIVSGEEMSAQYKFGNAFTFRSLCAHWFASNHLPRSTDTSEGFNRRWLILQFNQPVADKDIDRDIATKIITTEREAIAAWVVQALPRLVAAREYTLPASHKAMIGDVAVMNNSVRFFLQGSGKVAVSPEKTSLRTSAKVLYTAYSFFCAQETGARRVGVPRFLEMMRELVHQYGYTVDRVEHPNGTNEVFYSGLTLVGPGTV